jgi:hypothetical protein
MFVIMCAAAITAAQTTAEPTIAAPWRLQAQDPAGRRAFWNASPPVSD